MLGEVCGEVQVRSNFKKDWVVYIYNDDTTPIDLVVDMLVEVFEFNYHKATRLAYEVNDEEGEVVGKYPEKLARKRVEKGMKLIHDKGYSDFRLEAKEE